MAQTNTRENVQQPPKCENVYVQKNLNVYSKNTIDAYMYF